MSYREVGWVVFLAGLPFAHFLFRPLDLWHAQALWAQGWCVGLFALSLGTSGRTHRPNPGLAGFLLWVGLYSLFLWKNTMVVSKTYPLPLLAGLTHVLLLVMLYHAALSTWTAPVLDRLLKVLAYVGIVLLIYSVLQLLNLDQFFHDLDQNVTTDPMVGTIGNPSHLAVQLALLLPIFLLQPGRFWKGCAVVDGLLLLLTNSVGGLLAGWVTMAWFAWHRARWWVWLSVLGLCGLVGIGWVVAHPSVLNPHGRLEAWSTFWKVFTQQPLTGFGSGFVMSLSQQTPQGSPIFQWRHVHNEYFQMAMEYGIIGVGFLAWMVKDLIRDVVRLPKTPLVVALTGVLIAFGVSCLVNFSAHLWLTGSYAFVAYCGIRLLATEEMLQSP